MSVVHLQSRWGVGKPVGDRNSNEQNVCLPNSVAANSDVILVHKQMFLEVIAIVVLIKVFGGWGDVVNI